MLDTPGFLMTIMLAVDGLLRDWRQREAQRTNINVSREGVVMMGLFSSSIHFFFPRTLDRF